MVIQWAFRCHLSYRRRTCPRSVIRDACLRLLSNDACCRGSSKMTSSRSAYMVRVVFLRQRATFLQLGLSNYECLCYAAAASSHVRECGVLGGEWQ